MDPLTFAAIGQGVTSFIGQLANGGSPGTEFWRQMQGNGWANDQWARDYAKWLETYKPATWASGDIWDNWPQPSPFRQAWDAAGGVPLDANLKPLGAPSGSGSGAGGGSGTNKQLPPGGPTIWMWPWQPNAFKLAAPSVMLAWAGIFIGGPLLIWAVFFRRRRRRTNKRRSV